MIIGGFFFFFATDGNGAGRGKHPNTKPTPHPWLAMGQFNLVHDSDLCGAGLA